MRDMALACSHHATNSRGFAQDRRFNHIPPTYGTLMNKTNTRRWSCRMSVLSTGFGFPKRLGLRLLNSPPQFRCVTFSMLSDALVRINSPNVGGPFKLDQLHLSSKSECMEIRSTIAARFETEGDEGPIDPQRSPTRSSCCLSSSPCVRLYPKYSKTERRTWLGLCNTVCCLAWCNGSEDGYKEPSLASILNCKHTDRIQQYSDTLATFVDYVTCDFFCTSLPPGQCAFGLGSASSHAWQ